MKQSEVLTIGALLTNNRGELVKVETISSKRQRRKIGYHREGEPTKMRYVRLCECKPIPLNETILELNGFETDKDFDFYDGYNITVKHNNIPRCDAYGIWCVHELQALLSICGETERALNFKLQ